MFAERVSESAMNETVEPQARHSQTARLQGEQLARSEVQAGEV